MLPGAIIIASILLIVCRSVHYFAYYFYEQKTETMCEVRLPEQIDREPHGAIKQQKGFNSFLYFLMWRLAFLWNKISRTTISRRSKRYGFSRTNAVSAVRFYGPLSYFVFLWFLLLVHNNEQLRDCGTELFSF